MFSNTMTNPGLNIPHASAPPPNINTPTNLAHIQPPPTNLAHIHPPPLGTQFDPTGSAAYHPGTPYNPQDVYLQSLRLGPTPSEGPEVDMSSNKSDTSSNVSQLTDLSVLSNADVLRHIFGEVHGHREEARKDMQDLKETMNKGLADLTKILSDSIASNNTLFVRMSERLVTVEEDTSYLRVKLAEIQTDSSRGLAEFRRETAEGVADGRKTRLQLQQFQDHLDQKTGALVDKLSESAVKNAAEAAAHAVTEAIARMSVHADDDDDEDEDEDEEDGGVGHNEAVGKGHK